jgi:hypothetical protein
VPESATLQRGVRWIAALVASKREAQALSE